MTQPSLLYIMLYIIYVNILQSEDIFIIYTSEGITKEQGILENIICKMRSNNYLHSNY